MPRPCKRRRICALPRCHRFGPAEGGAAPPLTMPLDEYEAVRLIDLEGLTQEECAAQMGVARTTVQAIYAAARAKLADCLVNGRELRLAGGDFEVCGACGGCGCGRRCAHGCRKENDKTPGGFEDENCSDV